MMKNHIKDFAKSLNKESLLILGGTGLFGKTLLPALVREIEENNINVFKKLRLVLINILCKNKKNKKYIDKTKINNMKSSLIDEILCS